MHCAQHSHTQNISQLLPARSQTGRQVCVGYLQNMAARKAVVYQLQQVTGGTWPERTLQETGRQRHQQRSARWSQTGRPAPGRPGVHAAPAAAGLVGKGMETCKQTMYVCCRPDSSKPAHRTGIRHITLLTVPATSNWSSESTYVLICHANHCNSPVQDSRCRRVLKGIAIRQQVCHR